jgi:hypothetical protein
MRSAFPWGKFRRGLATLGQSVVELIFAEFELVVATANAALAAKA